MGWVWLVAGVVGMFIGCTASAVYTEADTASEKERMDALADESRERLRQQQTRHEEALWQLKQRKEEERSLLKDRCEDAKVPRDSWQTHLTMDGKCYVWVRDFYIGPHWEPVQLEQHQ